MAETNWTSVSEFVLLGLSERQDLQPLIFARLLATYLVNLAGNSVLLVLIWADPQLASPMYFFLSQLARVDIGLTSITLPHALVQAQTHHQTVPFTSCMAQLFLYLAVYNMEGYLLAAMAYDRYVAVCDPLRYSATVTQSLCLRMVAASWAVVISHALLHTVMTARLRFCRNRLQHFFCDVPPLLHLSCIRPFSNELVISTEGILVVLGPFTFILASYARIWVAVARLSSAQALRKALSTCGSHLTVVLLLYSTVTWLYFRPASSYTLGHDWEVAVFYTVVVPALNPLIYSLRNKDVASALRRAGRKILARGT